MPARDLSELDVRCSVFVLGHTPPARVRLQLADTSFVVPIHGPILQPTRHGTCVVFLPRQVRVCLSSKKNDSLVGPPPFIRSNAVKVPHPNATNTISIPAGTQAPGVPSGNFGKNSENPPQFARPVQTGNQNRCCFFSSLIKISLSFPLPVASCVLTPRTLQHYRRQAWVANSGNPRFTTPCCLNEFSDPGRHQLHRLFTCRWGRKSCPS